jgi:polyisoprenyl-phosphate glycosyltransferase
MVKEIYHTMRKDTLISIIVPVYNESAGLTAFHKALTKVIDKLPYQFEVIFVDDGSKDTSLEVLQELAKKDSRIRIVEFARNFGKELATTAGLHSAQGNAALMIDADLQHPVELIKEFIKKWDAGADVVVGLRDGRKKDSLGKRFASKTFYKILSALADVDITPNATDFRIVDRAVIDHFNRFTERNRMTRGLLDWLGFHREFITYQEKERHFGAASQSLIKLIKLAINSFISNSLLPLRVAGYLGVIITLFSVPLGLFIFVEKYVLKESMGFHFSGSVILVVVLLFLVGIILMSLGLIALYIANIHTEVTGRPLYVIRRHYTERKPQADQEEAKTRKTARRISPAIASRARKVPPIKK